MSVRSQYEVRVRSGALTRDPAQEQVVGLLDALGQSLEGYAPVRKSSALGWLLGAARAC